MHALSEAFWPSHTRQAGRVPGSGGLRLCALDVSAPGGGIGEGEATAERVLYSTAFLIVEGTAEAQVDVAIQVNELSSVLGQVFAAETAACCRQGGSEQVGHAARCVRTGAAVTAKHVCGQDVANSKAACVQMTQHCQRT